MQFLKSQLSKSLKCRYERISKWCTWMLESLMPVLLSLSLSVLMLQKNYLFFDVLLSTEPGSVTTRCYLYQYDAFYIYISVQTGVSLNATEKKEQSHFFGEQIFVCRYNSQNRIGCKISSCINNNTTIECMPTTTQRNMLKSFILLIAINIIRFWVGTMRFCCDSHTTYLFFGCGSLWLLGSLYWFFNDYCYCCC